MIKNNSHRSVQAAAIQVKHRPCSSLTPRKRQGQAGGFLILSAFLIVVFFILFSIGAESETIIPLRAPSVWVSQVNYTIEGAYDYINACLNKSATYALLMYGRNAGLSNVNISTSPLSRTPILLDLPPKTSESVQNTSGLGPLIYAPSKESAQAILASLIASSMESCVANLTIFSQHGFSVTPMRGVATRVTVTPEGVTAYYTNQVTISKDKRKKTYQNFSWKSGVRLLDMITTAGEIINFQSKRTEDADLSALKDSNLEIVFFTETGQDGRSAAKVTALRDPDHPIDGAPYEFWFATVRE